MFRFAYPWVIYSGFFLLLLAIAWRWFFYQAPCYIYPFTQFLHRTIGFKKNFSIKRLIFCIRLATIIILVLSTARPQDADDNSRVEVEGNDIILMLDVSGSMQLFTDFKDMRSRFDVAKQEALNFIRARNHDPIGLILFGATAISRCPVTLDKAILEEILNKLELGEVDPEGTVLAVGLGMAVNRLRFSQSASKIIILLTDGAPSEQDIDPAPVLTLAKKYGIKVYTIGVGGKDGGYAFIQPHGFVHFKTPLNAELLKKIADETGGESFLAEKLEDIQSIYQTIDALEKKSYDIPLYARYNELFFPFVLAALLLLCCEIIIRWYKVIV